MFLRFILTSLAAYVGYRFFKGLVVSKPKNEEVKGKQKSKPLDLRGQDVDDAQFEDLENGNS